MKGNQSKNNLTLQLGNREIYISKKYDFFYTINEIILGLEFLTGSLCFLFNQYETFALTLYICGSIQLLIKPFIRIGHEVHIRKLKQKK